MISFLPDTSRGANGDLTVDFGTYFPNAVLILKRTVFDGMKQEEEEITIEVEIRQLMAKTLAAAGKPDYDASVNIAEWQELGGRAKATGEDKYKYADVVEWNTSYAVGPIVTESLISLQTMPLNAFGEGSGITEWSSDLPCLQNNNNSPFKEGPIEVFDAKLPNLVDGTMMFYYCHSLTSFQSDMPSLQNAAYMFYLCYSLTSFQCDMPAGLTRNVQSMFVFCKLDIESVERISRTIAICTGTDEWDKTIHLGVSQACHDDTNFQTYIDAMGQKNWVVVVDVH